MEENFIDKSVRYLREKWGVKSKFQVLVILVVFAITGSLSLYVSRFIFDLVNLTESDPFWLKTIVYIVTVIPVYHILLFVIGSLLGQHEFFKKFIMKIFGRFNRSNKEKVKSR